MNDFMEAFAAAFALIVGLDEYLIEIIVLSLSVSTMAVFIAGVLGLPLGTLLATVEFPGRTAFVVFFNSLMGLPPVVVGLVVYLLLSRSGPFGTLGLLFSPTSMIIAQVILILPIMVALIRQVMNEIWREYAEYFNSIGSTGWQNTKTLLWDGRFKVTTAVLAGFGRASAEVGAVMIVGGNIDHVTRVMTTAIALETSKGNLALALGLGIILLILAVIINICVFVINDWAESHYE